MTDNHPYKHPFVVLVYSCTDPACPPHRRAVAHCFERRPHYLRPLPATDYSESVDECRTHLNQFLEEEVERERARNDARERRRKKR